MPAFNGSVLFRQYRAIAEILARFPSTSSPFFYSVIPSVSEYNDPVTLTRAIFVMPIYDICSLNLAGRTPFDYRIEVI